MTKSKAFTLAEVLITLAILGVVAATVIPSLMNNIKNEQLVAMLKKDYSTLSQATQMIVADNGGSIKGVCSDNDCLRDLYGKYIKELKTCNNGAYIGECWHSNSGTKVAHYLDGTAITGWGPGGSVGVLVDGGFARFGSIASDCDSNLPGWSESLKNNIGCGSIAIDINGYKAPNVMGRDIFYFAILENRIAPYGTDLDTYSSTCNTSGYGCAAKVLREGAINY